MPVTDLEGAHSHKITRKSKQYHYTLETSIFVSFWFSKEILKC